MSPVLLFGAVIGMMGFGCYIEQWYLERKQSLKHSNVTRKDESVDPQKKRNHFLP